MSHTAPAPQKDWVNIVFLMLTPILGIPVLAACTWFTGFEWWMAGLFLGMYCAVGLSVCAGYHRYFAHKSYECARPVQWLLAVFGAMAVQNSILRWAAGHRRHHKFAEEEWDPYSITRGFWWAHIVWVFHHDPHRDNFENVPDLLKNPIVHWQHRWYNALVIVGGFGIPTLIGALFGDALAGLLWGGFLRIVVVHHSTFLVNSLAHWVGTPTYDSHATARDNWAVALLTFGEGYHSFHHRFPSDFRNGIRWYDWDPAKWFIATLRLLGLASRLHETEAPRIEQARMTAAVKQMQDRIARAESSLRAEIHARIQRAHDAFDAAMACWRKLAEERRAGLADRWRETRRLYHERIALARREWREVLNAISRLSSANDLAS